jgi:hypothetical protein
LREGTFVFLISPNLRLRSVYKIYLHLKYEGS